MSMRKTGESLVLARRLEGSHISAIADMLSQHRGARSRSSLEGSMQEDSDAPAPTVLPSSTELFYFYGQTLEQCGKYTTGEPMKKLARVFGKWLKVYSSMSYPIK